MSPMGCLCDAVAVTAAVSDLVVDPAELCSTQPCCLDSSCQPAGLDGRPTCGHNVTASCLEMKIVYAMRIITGSGAPVAGGAHRGIGRMARLCGVAVGGLGLVAAAGPGAMLLDRPRRAAGAPAPRADPVMTARSRASGDEVRSMMSSPRRPGACHRSGPSGPGTDLRRDPFLLALLESVNSDVTPGPEIRCGNDAGKLRQDCAAPGRPDRAAGHPRPGRQTMGRVRACRWMIQDRAYKGETPLMRALGSVACRPSGAGRPAGAAWHRARGS